MKKVILVLGTLVALLAASLALCLCPCTRIETGRLVKLDPSSQTVQFIVRGFRVCPVTAEGPFPHWVESVQLHLSASAYASATASGGRFDFPRDFKPEFLEQVTSGYLEFDPKRNVALVSLEYNPQFGWLAPVKGTFPLATSHVSSPSH
jgi:hypothetical protein